MITAEYRNTADIAKLEGNPRKIEQTDMEKLMQSIRNLPMYFEAHPIVLSDRTGKLVVIDGNQRLEVARRLGMKQVPTALLSGLTEEQEREIIIRANVNNGEWDMELLQEWDKEQLEDFGVDVTWEEETSIKAKGELDADDFNDEMEMKLKFTSEEYEFVASRLSEEGNSKETALLTILGYGERIDSL